MVIVWLKPAKADLINYKKNSKILIKENVKKYISTLVDSVEILRISPKLGKFFCLINNTELRQLVFKMHRIFYYIKGDKIYILAVIHTSRDIDKVIQYLNDLIKYL